MLENFILYFDVNDKFYGTHFHEISIAQQHCLDFFYAELYRICQEILKLRVDVHLRPYGLH